MSTAEPSAPAGSLAAFTVGPIAAGDGADTANATGEVLGAAVACARTMLSRPPPQAETSATRLTEVPFDTRRESLEFSNASPPTFLCSSGKTRTPKFGCRHCRTVTRIRLETAVSRPRSCIVGEHLLCHGATSNIVLAAVTIIGVSRSVRLRSVTRPTRFAKSGVTNDAP